MNHGPSHHDRISGCLLGGACGDALGAPVEFMNAKDISSRYGPDGITQFDRAYGVLGSITDDTQMTLFTVEGFIRAWVRGQIKGIGHPPTVIHHAYLRWFQTQEQPFSTAGLTRIGTEFDGWLIQDRRLWARRAPGNTCLSALHQSRDLGALASNDSKGCGGVMRVAPLGFWLLFMGDEQETFDLAAESAHVTHGHPSGYVSAGALAVIIGVIARGEPVAEAVATALPIAARAEGSDEVVRALKNAIQLSRQPDWRKRLSELGQGWVAEEALAISVLCALAAQSTEEAIVAAVNHSGNSDSTGAITGNIMGALHGSQSLPRTWVEGVELRDVIQTLADDLTSVVEGRADPDALWDRYPGH